ncbi:Cell number regulator 6 [Zea mays]|uniref:Cell number regulator 6 n=1 Tax=Zea mays TaxID=4577 RepID=A0A1D6PML7_MAIZE|nr:Cell number regulator 6 [Zea mays]
MLRAATRHATSSSPRTRTPPPRTSAPASSTSQFTSRSSKAGGVASAVRSCPRATSRPPTSPGPPGSSDAPMTQRPHLYDLPVNICMESLGRTGLFCPCVLFGRNVEAVREDIPWTTPCVCHAVFVEGGITLAILTAIFHGVDPRTSFLIGEGLVFSWWLCATYTGIFRQGLQRKYHLKNSPCDPCMVHCCLHWCANCQEHRERTGRLAENNAVPMTVVNPPPVQEMSMLEEVEEKGAEKSEHDDVEVIPL